MSTSNPLPTVNSGLKTILQGAADAVLAGLDTVPVLDNPLLEYLDKAAIDWLVGQLYTELVDVVDFSIINTETSTEAGNTSQAAGALKTAEASGDANAIATANQNFANAFGNLIHNDTVASS